MKGDAKCNISAITNHLWGISSLPLMKRAGCLGPEHEEADTPALKQAKEWLSVYFSGKEPGFCPPVHLDGTPFQLTVWKTLQKIPYGKTCTYGEIAKEIAVLKGLPQMSPQAVGGAVGHNQISIIIPCHRVVGTNGSLTGYAGGIEKKLKLLALEKVDTDKFFIPKKGTAL